MKRLRILKLLILLSLFPITEAMASETYWLVIGSYRQGPGSRPEVSGITSPSLYAIQMKTLEDCNNAGKKITNEIFKPVWQFDNKWTCISGGVQK